MHPRSDNTFFRGAYALVRSVVLAVSTLAIIGVLFAVYQYSTGGSDSSATGGAVLPVDPSAVDPSGTESSAVTMGERPLGEGSRFHLVEYEPGTHRARMELESTGWRPVGNAQGDTQQIEVDEPEIRLLTPAGQRIRIRADSGVLDIVKTGQTTEPRRGRLSGDVRVDVDRLSEAERDALPADERDGANDDARMVRLTFDSVSFDKSEGRLETAGVFSLRMREAEVHGRGLYLTYNEVNNRVEHFEIAQGGSVSVRGVQSLIEGDRPRGQQENVGSGERENEEPGPGGSAADVGDVPLETYVATIEGEVNIRRFEGGQNVRRLAADMVRVLFDFSREQREAVRAGRSTVSMDADAAGNEGRVPKAAAAGDDHVTLEWTGRLVVRPEPEDRSQDSTTPRLRILATGREVRLADRLGEVTCRKLEVHRETGDVWVSGLGDDRVVLAITDLGTLVGGNMVIKGDGRTARIDGPARWVGPVDTSAATNGGAKGDGEVFDLRFDQSAEIAIGRHVQHLTDAVSGKAAESTKDYVRSATFTGDVMFRRGGELLAGDVVTLEFGEPTAAEGLSKDLQSLDAHGSVLLVRKGGGADDRVTCADLHLTFTPGPDGRPFPRTADVRGDVVITRGDLMVTAMEYVMLEMAPLTRRGATVDTRTSARTEVRGSHGGWTSVGVGRGSTPLGVEKTTAGRPEVGIEWLAAVGSVTASDPTRNLSLSAESLVAELVNGRDISVARLTGPEDGPAFVALGDRSITAHRIDADVAGESADVYGAGDIRLLTRRGLDGSRLETPLPIEVSWTQAMSLSGRRNTARFVGDIHAVSRRRLANQALPQQEDVTFDCEELVIDFADVDPASAKGGNAGARQRGRPRGLKSAARMGGGGLQFNREPVYVVASRNVVGVFTTVDALTGQVTKRNRFAADKLTVDLRAELLSVPGSGSLLIEDYERPAAAASRNSKGGSLFASAADGLPSQTYISWSGSLSYHRARNRADFRDSVHLDHRRGRDMVLSDEQLASNGFLAAGDPGVGRRTTLDCAALVVEFAAPTPTASASVGGMSIRDIRQLEATGGVRLVDNSFTVDAFRIVKYDNSNLLRVYGTADREAEIYGLDSGTGQFRALEFSYDIETGRVDAVTLQIRDRR